MNREELIEKEIEEFEAKNGKVKFTEKVLDQYKINKEKFDNRV